MAVLRLFAGAREAAGTSSVKIDALSVQEVLDKAGELYGSDLAKIIAGSKVWLNGEQASFSDEVTDRDEVAVLPPVSGGI